MAYVASANQVSTDPDAIKVFEFYDFAGGLVNKAAPHLLLPNQLQVCNGADLRKTGVVRAFKGATLISSYDDTVDDIYYQNLFTNPGLIVRSGTTVYDRNTPILYKSVDSRHAFCLFNNWLIFVNGTYGYKYDQQGVTTMGNSGYTYTWEDEYAPSGGGYLFTQRSESGYLCTQIWEAEFVDAENRDFASYTTGIDRISGASYLDYITDDEDNQTYYLAVQLGIDAPTSAPSVAEGAAGALTGQYGYEVTFINDQGMESNPSTADSADVVSKKINLTDIPVANDPQIVGRKIYRTEAGGATYKFLDVIEDNYTTTYEDNAADATLGTEVEVDHYTPPTAIDVREHLALLFLLHDPNVVWWSKSYDVWEGFPTSNYEPFGTEAMQGRMMTNIGEELEVVLDTDIWRRTGATTDDFQKKASYASRGACGPKAVAEVGPTIVFVDSTGIFEFDGLQDERMSGPIDFLFKSSSEEFDTINGLATDDSKHTRVVCEYLDDELLIAYPTEAAITGCDRILRINIPDKNFTLMEVSGITDIAVDAVKKDWYCSKGNSVYKMCQKLTDDDGNDISFHLRTKEFSKEFGSFSIPRIFGRIKFDGDPKSGSLTYTVYVDDVSCGTWTFSNDGRSLERRFVDIATTGFRISLDVVGTRDAEFYGFSCSIENKGF